MNLIKTLTLTLTIAFASSQLLLAHGGRRFDVVVIDGQLHAQGYNSGTFDQGDYVRPFTNAIHNHWAPGSTVATLPGFDVTFANSFVDENGTTQQYGYQNQASLLSGFDLSIELTGAGKWTSPTTTAFVASPFAANESIEIDFLAASVDTDNIGMGSALMFDLVTDWSNPLNRIDLDPDYFLDLTPEASGSIYFLEWQLSSENPAIESSDSVYTIFSPPMQVHSQSLALEQTLGTSLASVPEPSALGLVGLGLAVLATRRRRS
jgi:hypothetical protein